MALQRVGVTLNHQLERWGLEGRRLATGAESWAAIGTVSVVAGPS